MRRRGTRGPTRSSSMRVGGPRSQRCRRRDSVGGGIWRRRRRAGSRQRVNRRTSRAGVRGSRSQGLLEEARDQSLDLFPQTGREGNSPIGRDRSPRTPPGIDDDPGIPVPPGRLPRYLRDLW